MLKIKDTWQILANLVQILYLTPVLGGNVVGKFSALPPELEFMLFNSLATDSMNKSWSNWLILLTSWPIWLKILHYW